MRNLKRALSLALASVMLLGMMVVGTSASYTDVDSKDNLEAIEVLKLVGVMTGDDKGNFNPDKMVSRNEMAVVMCNLLGLKTGGSHPFTDVPAWAAPYVAACYNNGIIAGISANKFGGDANVTAVQAGLMVMKALGYFGYAGEFGDSWKLATVKQADKINLYDGINAYTDQVMTRNEIAKMVLNALECTVQVVTEQGGVSVDGNGISVNVKPTYDYQDAANNSGKDYGGGNVRTMQLCEKLYGNDLKKDTSNNTTDAFGRPATKWTYNNDSVTCPDAPDAVYTASVKGKKIYEDLGKPSTVTTPAANAKEDGGTYSIPAGFAIASGNNTEIGDKGTLTEVYYDKDTKTATIVLINTYVAKVTDCDKNDDGKYDITTDAAGVDSYESDVAYANDDVVLYTKVVKSNSNDEVKSMALAEKVSGEVTRVKNADSFVIAGTTYKYSAQFVGTKLAATSVDFDTDVYLDSYGYAIMLDNTKSTTNYAVVVGASNGTWDENDADKEAKLLFPDGTVSVVKVDTVNGGNGTLVKNQIVTYTVNSSKEYTLTLKGNAITNQTQAATQELKVEKGKATVKVNGQTYTANSKTEFFIYNSDDKSYTTYTGIKNVSDLSVASGYKVTTDVTGTVLKAVYVMANTDITNNTSDVATFIYVKGNEKEIKDTDLGNYYTFKAVVDGKITTVDVSSNLVTANGANSTFKVNGNANHLGYILSKVKTNNDGIITAVTIEATDLSGSTLTLDNNGDGYIVGNNVAVVKAEDDIITIGGVGLAYSSDVKVFEYNKADSKFVSKTISSLKSANYDIYVQIDDSTVVGIYYIK